MRKMRRLLCAATRLADLAGACVFILGAAVTELRRHSFFSLVDWQRMLEKDYRPPMVPDLSSELDLRYFSPSFTAEPPVKRNTLPCQLWPAPLLAPLLLFDLLWLGCRRLVVLFICHCFSMPCRVAIYCTDT